MKLFYQFAAAMALVAMTACSSQSKQPNNPDAELQPTDKEFVEAEQTEDAVNAATGKPIELGENDILSFEAPIPAPVVVDFSASWCGPCKMMHPIFDKLAKKYDGQVVFIYVDIDKAPQLAKEYGVEAVPTLLFVNTSGDIQRQVGAMTEEELEGAIQAIIESSKPTTANSVSPR